jgi:Protein of unknown function (DUF2442)
MNEIVKVTAVEPLDGFRVRATFSDGAIKEVDLSEVFARGGVFEPIREDRDRFLAVRVDSATGTVEWPGEVDLDAEVLYGRFEPASGARIVREPGVAV